MGDYDPCVLILENYGIGLRTKLTGQRSADLIMGLQATVH